MRPIFLLESVTKKLPEGLEELIVLILVFVFFRLLPEKLNWEGINGKIKHDKVYERRLNLVWIAIKAILLTILVSVVFWLYKDPDSDTDGYPLIRALIFLTCLGSELWRDWMSKSYDKAESTFDKLRTLSKEGSDKDKAAIEKAERKVKEIFERTYWRKVTVSLVELVIYILWISITWHKLVGDASEVGEQSLRFTKSTEFWVILFAYVIVTFPTAYLMRLITIPWQKQLPVGNPGLKNAGKWIGIIERLLILTFIFMNSLANVGLLISAKSIIRYGEISKSQNRKGAEYILIGTLISFGIAISVGIWAYSAAGEWIQGFFPRKE